MKIRKEKKMGTWHMDPRCEDAIIKLNDALCSFERATSREYTLILVPHSSDEQIMMSQSGKPLPPDSLISPKELLDTALRLRDQGTQQMRL